MTSPLICKTLFKQARGLMFRKKQDILIILKKPKRVSLHMFFVFYPIDVFFLNEKKQIIEIKRNFKPFTFYNSKNKIKYIYETAKLRQKIENVINKLNF